MRYVPIMAVADLCLKKSQSIDLREVVEDVGKGGRMINRGIQGIDITDSKTPGKDICGRTG